MAKASLETASREFAGKLSSLLNLTVCDGVRVAAIEAPATGVAVVGFGLTKKSVDLRAIPLRIGNAEARVCLRMIFSVSLGDHGYLTVDGSQFGLFLDPDFNRLLVHWDYVRLPKAGYPRAHVQVDGFSENFASLFASSQRRGDPPPTHSELPRLHFPVGGRRFRPSLEDVIEFAIYHGMCGARSDALEQLEASRRRFDEIQLRAAVRNYPELAVDVLRETGHVQ